MRREIKRKQGNPISPASLERLRRLADMPDELINTDDIPERPFGPGKRVRSPVDSYPTTEEQRKAS